MLRSRGASGAGGLRAPRATLAVAATAVALLCGGSSASALVGRGHHFQGTFEGVGESQLHDPTGVAVDQASGEVYVVDRAQPHERVERFRPDGNGGFQFVSSFAVRSPEDLAIDNSSEASDPSAGDVYVVGAEEEGAGHEEHDVLYKYDPATEKVLFKKTIFHAPGKEELALEDINGVAVDASGGLWVYWGEEGLISGFSDAEANRWEPALSKDLEIPFRFECRASRGFAVAPDDSALYVSHERETPLEECGEEETTPSLVAKFNAAGALLSRALDEQPTSAVAVDSQGEVYADNLSSVAAFAPDGSFSQRFGSPQLSGGGALAAVGEGDVFVAEPSEGKVAVFAPDGAGAPSVAGVLAQNLSSSSERLSAQIDPDGLATHYYFQYGSGDCAKEAAGCTDLPLPPGGEIAASFGDRLLSVQAEGLQANTTYHYRVIATNEDGSSESAQSSETFFTTLPSALGVLADHREWEQVSPAEKHGALVEPISREGALIQASADGSAIAWTASSPVSGEGRGNRRPEPVQVLSTRSGDGWSSQDIATPHTKGEGFEPGEGTEYRFFSSDLSRALVQPQVRKEPLENPPLAAGVSEKTIYRRDNSTGLFEALVDEGDVTGETAPGERSHFGGTLEFQGASEDLSHVIFGSEVPLLAGDSGEGLYQWQSGSPLALVSVLPNGQAASEPALGDLGRVVRGALSSDGSAVFWTQGAADEGPLYERDTTSGATVQINAAQGVSEPDEEEREEGLDEVHFQAADPSGGRVFFTDSWPLSSESSLEPLRSLEVIEEAPGKSRSVERPLDLYEYDSETRKLSDLSVDQHVGEPADVLGTLPGISEDGSYVYFVANGVLAPGAAPGDCQRTNPFNLPHPEQACNLYVSEPDPEHPGARLTRLIARVSEEDAADWGAGNSPHPGSERAGDLGGLTSQVSANGRYLAFMSAQPLTGYDNLDSNPQANGAKDEEVYLYDASEGRLVCASCEPSGEPPHGVFDTEEAGEGLGLTVDRPETWTGHWLAGSLLGWTLFALNNPIAEHQSRYLSNNGRLFFDSADALLKAVSARTRSEQIAGKPAQVGVENVYEYEPSGQGSCTAEPGCLSLISSGTSEQESAFLDASENGDDAFFITAAPLAPSDTDNSLDVYDAKVCGTTGAPACLPAKPPPPPLCSGEECRPPQTPQPAFTAPATVGFSGPGNTTRLQTPSSSKTSAPKLSSAQKLAAALKACKRINNRHKRSACQARARKRFKPSSPKRKTAKRSSSRRRR